MKVVGYRDLRPVDWASGKRMPLEAGAGHGCDRCGREHAVVYTVLDEQSGRIHAVGSGCAKQQFGFDVESDATAKKLVTNAKRADAVALDNERHSRATECADIIVNELRLRVQVPEPQIVVLPGKHDVVVVGDSRAWVQFRTREETVQVAVLGFYDRRIAELIPPEWLRIEVGVDPGSRNKMTMARLVERLVKRELNAP